MWFWVMAQAKENVSTEAIDAKRKLWVSQGKDQQVGKRCRFAQRYLVVGHAPTKVFWLLDTDDPSIVELMTEHFGELWTVDTHVVSPQPIVEAVGSKPSSY
jgi:hypothetical protein